MKRTVCLFALALLTAAAARAQEADTPQASTLTVKSSLVFVPAVVKTKKGAPVFTLQADDFIALDDGVPQKLHLEEGTDAQPIAVVFVVQTGGAGADHVEDYTELQTLLDNFVGAVPHSVAVDTFDSRPVEIQSFTRSNGVVADALANVQPGDKGAAIYDGLAYAVQQLRSAPASYRRAIVLVSETIDRGSKTSLADAARLIGDTNTAVYAISFGSMRADTHDEAAKLTQDEPNPPGGCMARPDPETQTEAEKKRLPSRTAQAYECASEVLPPLRIATIAYKLLLDGLRKNAPRAVARATGGEHMDFHDASGFQHALEALANDLPNRYILSFRPQNPHPGLHALQCWAKDRPGVRTTARTSYFVDPTP